MTGIIKRLTANFGLRIPIFDAPNWGREMEKNFDIIDAGLYSLLGMGNVRGLWDNSTVYTQGDRAVDPVNGEIYQAEQTHTSPATGTFAQARTASPTRWKRVLQSAQFKGQWKTATVYNSNEFVHDGISKYGVVIDKYTSGASYNADVTAGKIYTLIDSKALVDDITAKSDNATAKASAAATSATNAKNSETAAKASETAALASKNAAATSAGEAATSATNAASSANAANTSKTAAATSESNALTYRNNASASATSAANSASAAAASAALAQEAATTTSSYEVQVHSATSKATPVDADEIAMVDSAASWARKKLTWANLKKTLLASPVATALLALDVSGTGRGDMIWRRSGNDRWHIGLSSGTETGADAGSNLEILSYNDAGALKQTVATINRATGSMTLYGQFQPLTNDTAASPSYSWSGDINTGMWNAGPDMIGWSVGGSNKMTLTTSILELAQRLEIAVSSEGLRLSAPNTGNDPYMAFFVAGTRQGYFQSQDGTSTSNGLKLVNEQAATNLTFVIRNTGSAEDGLGFVVGSTGYNVFHSGNAATANEIRANTPNKVLTTSGVWSAAGIVTITAASTVTPDFGAFVNGSITLGSTNVTFANPINVVNGQCGFIRIVQNGTTARTISFGTAWKFENGITPSIPTTLGSVSFLYYQVYNSSTIHASLVKALA